MQFIDYIFWILRSIEVFCVQTFFLARLNEVRRTGVGLYLGFTMARFGIGVGTQVVPDTRVTEQWPNVWTAARQRRSKPATRSTDVAERGTTWC